MVAPTSCIVISIDWMPAFRPDARSGDPLSGAESVLGLPAALWRGRGDASDVPLLGVADAGAAIGVPGAGVGVLGASEGESQFDYALEGKVL